MACTDTRIFQFPNAEGGGTYKLTVTGPKGAYTAIATFADSGSSEEIWPPDQIVAPKEKSKDVVGNCTYANIIVVTCVADADQKVKVEASLDKTKYCREIDCVKGRKERVIHAINRT